MMEKNKIKTSVLLFEKQIVYIPLLEFFIITKLLRIEGNKQVYEVTPVIWLESKDIDYYFDEEELEFFEGGKND